MKYLVFIITSLFCASSCSNNTCDLSDYKNGKWIKIDSSVSYKLCSKGERILTPEDSVQIEFLGILKDDQHILIQNPEGFAILTLFSDIPLGNFKRSQLDSIQSLLKIFPAMTKNAEYLIRIKLNTPEMPEVSDILTAYFKPEAGTPDILKLNEKVSKLVFVDSVIFVSSETTKNMFSNETDSTWRQFLENNPLPPSSNIYIKKGLYNSGLKDSLANLFSNESIISDISYPSDKSDFLAPISASFNFPFFIKIKS